MTKKKVTHNCIPPQNQEMTHQTIAMDAASEKLRSLNSRLLKEINERRQEVNSLKLSNGSLVSKLTRSEMEKNALQAELTQLGDDTEVLLEIERNLVLVFVSVQVNQQEEVIKKERVEFGRVKMEIENKFGVLEREMRDVLSEKSEIEKVKREKESEIGFLEKKLSELDAVINKEKGVSSRLGRERDAMRAALEAQVLETNRLRSKLIETEKKNIEFQEEGQKLLMEYNLVVEEKQERERMIKLIVRDKDSIERSLGESNRVIEEMKREIEKTVRDKKVIEEERNEETIRRSGLEYEVSAFREMVLNLRREEEKLHATVASLEKRCFEGEERQKEMVMQIDVLVEEKQKGEKNLESLIEEKGLVMRDLNEVMKQLDYGKRKGEEITREKIEIEEAKNRGESEIVELQKQLVEFRDTILSLEESCRGQIERIKQLESEVSQYRDAFVEVKTERDEVIKGLDEEKMNGMNLRAKILELEKKTEETLKVLGDMKSENGDLIGEKKELESRCAMLTKDIASVENKLAKARKDFDDILVKLGLANANSELVLNLLRNTASLVCRSKDEMGVKDDEILVDQQKTGEEFKPYVRELEAIKNAFKSGEAKVEDMKRQLESLKNSVAQARKSKGIWTWVSSATTILAAASVFYVARGN